MDNIEAKDQPVPAPAEPARKILPPWLTYGVFGIVLLVTLVVLLIPLPFTDYLFKFESSSFKWSLSIAPLIIAGLIILAYLAFYLIRVFRKTAIKPVQQNTVPLIERLFFGPLSLWAAMFICAEIFTRTALRDQGGEPSVAAAFTAAALLFSFPLAFLLHGVLTFWLAQTRKRYAIMFFVSVAIIAAMPLLLKVTAPLAEAAYNFQQSQDQEKISAQLSQAHSMQDCANVGGDFGWVQCISTYMNSKADYFECLKQAPSKKRPIDDQGVEYLCDREYESFIRRFTGHATEPGPDGVTYVAVPAEGTIAINDCTDLQRYRAWSACVSYAINTKEDFSTCLQQSFGRTSEFGDVGTTACFKAFPKGFASYGECVAGVPTNQQDACLPLIMTTLSAGSDVSWCYKLPTTDPAHQYNSQAATCLKELIKLQGNSLIKIVNICVYVSQQQSVESVNGAPCSGNLMDSYNAVKDITSVQDCFSKVGQTIEPQREICINRTVHSAADYQACLTLSDKEGAYSQRTSGSYCREAWPSGT